MSKRESDKRGRKSREVCEGSAFLSRYKIITDRVSSKTMAPCRHFPCLTSMCWSIAPLSPQGVPEELGPLWELLRRLAFQPRSVWFWRCPPPVAIWAIQLSRAAPRMSTQGCRAIRSRMPPSLPVQPRDVHRRTRSTHSLNDNRWSRWKNNKLNKDAEVDDYFKRKNEWEENVEAGRSKNKAATRSLKVHFWGTMANAVPVVALRRTNPGVRVLHRAKYAHIN